MTERNDTINGWLFTVGSMFIGFLLLVDTRRFVSSPAWQLATAMAPGDPEVGRLLLGWSISLLGALMVAAMVTRKLMWLPFILASLWFCFITVALIRSTFVVTNSGTPGFVVWGLVALALMNFGVAHLPVRK